MHIRFFYGSFFSYGSWRPHGFLFSFETQTVQYYRWFDTNVKTFMNIYYAIRFCLVRHVVRFGCFIYLFLYCILYFDCDRFLFIFLYDFMTSGMIYFVYFLVFLWLDDLLNVSYTDHKTINCIHNAPCSIGFSTTWKKCSSFSRFHCCFPLKRLFIFSIEIAFVWEEVHVLNAFF